MVCTFLYHSNKQKNFWKKTFFPQEHENCNMILYSVQTKHMLKEEV